MKKRTERPRQRQGENAASAELTFLVEPMLAGMTAARQHLLAWVHAQGLAALDELFRNEAVALAGRKGRHQATRTHHHWGTTATELTFGGRRLQVRRPRVRGTNGQEATLPSVAAFRGRDPLSARMMPASLHPRTSWRAGRGGAGSRGERRAFDQRPAGWRRERSCNSR